MKTRKISDRTINNMQRLTKKAIVLLLITSVLPLSGCSDTDAAKLPGNAEPVSKVSDNNPDAKEESTNTPAVSDNEKDHTPEEDTSQNEPVKVKITRDDRSVAMTEYGKDDGVFSFYYETALLPDSVKNHEKINKKLEEKKEDFFRTKGGFEEEDIKESIKFGSNKECLIAAVKSVYLDEKYYSLAIEQFCSFGSGVSKLTGYTFDLNSGEEVGIEQVLEKKDDELSSLLFNKVKSYFEDHVVADNTNEKDFLNDESYGTFDYCISRDGSVYLLYDENRFLEGYMGSSACSVGKYPGCSKQALFSEMKEFADGEWYSLSLEEIDRVREFLKLEKDDYDDARDRVPCCRNNEWYVPVLFSRRDDNGDRVFASAEAKADDPGHISDTGDKLYEDILGEWYSIESYEDVKTGETVPLTGCIISDNTMKFYDYDPSECCYKLKDSKSIWIKRTMWQFIIDADDDDTDEKTTYMTDVWDECRLDMYKTDNAEGPFTGTEETGSGSGSLISLKSADYQRIFKTDRSLLLYPTDDCVSQSLSVPDVRDGKTLPGPDCVEVHFNWDASPGAEGYEVLEENKYVERPDDYYTYPELTEVSDHYFVTGAQDDFDFRIRVRAYKTDGGRRIYSEWSDYATGGTGGSYYDLDQASEAKGEKKEYIPALNEYAKIFGKDDTVYGLRAPDEKREIYEEISKEQFDEIRKKYEIPADIERKPFSEYNVKN